jgi:hypothetical protein
MRVCAAEDVHVHIHFDAPPLQYQQLQPACASTTAGTAAHLNHPPSPVPAHFSLDGMNSHCHRVPHSNLPPQSHMNATHGSVAAAPAHNQVAAPPLVPPPTMPLQPLTRLIEFDDSLADLVSQVEASMHVSEDNRCRAPSSMGESGPAQTMQTNVAQHRQTCYSTCDSATSLSGESAAKLGGHMHAPNVCMADSGDLRRSVRAPLQQDDLPRQGAQSEPAGVNWGPNRSNHASIHRCGEVRTTSLKGRTVARVKHPSDTVASHSCDSYTRSRSSIAQAQNSFKSISCCGQREGFTAREQRHAEGVLTPHASNVGIGKRNVHHRSRGAECERIGFSEVEEKLAEQSWSDVHQHKAQPMHRGVKVSSLSCLDEQDEEMLGVLNCLM